MDNDRLLSIRVPLPEQTRRNQLWFRCSCGCGRDCRCGRWRGYRRTIQVDTKIIKGLEIDRLAARVQVGAGYGVAGRDQGQLGREREIGGEDHILSRDLHIVNRVGTLLDRRDAFDLACDGLCGATGGCAA